MPRREGQYGRVYEAAELFVREGLLADGSMFTPGRSVITRQNLDALFEAFNAQPDESAATFMDKFERQLSEVDPVIVQLAAEIIFFHLVIARDIGQKRKRELVNEVLGWMAEPVVLPPALDEALATGLSNTGIAFKTYRPHQLWFLIEFLRMWKALDPQRQRALLDDPQAFRAMAWDVPMSAAYTQREALLHLVHPDYFEAMVSREHKALIAKAFDDRVTDKKANVDAALHEIRQSIVAEAGPFQWFYDDHLKHQWWADAPGSEDDEPAEDEGPSDEAAATGVPKKAWLVRHYVNDQDRIADWLEDAYAAIGWGQLGDAPLSMTRRDLTQLGYDTYPDDTPRQVQTGIGNVWRFVRSASAGDLIVTPNGQDIYVGILASDAIHVPGEEEAFRREVEWLNPADPIQRGDLSASAYSRLRSLLTVTDASDDVAEFARRAKLTLGAPEPEKGESPEPVVQLRPVTKDFADKNLLDLDWLNEVVDLLRDKRQIVLYGPPGTGKTYLAQELADHLTSKGGTSQLVQFHPSYAYEDFFEGFRPQQASDATGGITFQLVPGPMRSMAEEALKNPGNPYVLIVDEINRANLAKVFGELYFLLEYRDRDVALQYSPDSAFRLPKNLFIIGTMNTADRSIALVDAAMRRRFYFKGLFPQQHPIDKLLHRWLQSKGLSTEPAELLAKLNEAIGDPDFAVGPSYLMNEKVADPAWLERIWHHAIQPLLEEHFYGTGRHVAKEFSIEALRRGPMDVDREASPYEDMPDLDEGDDGEA